MSVIKSQKKGFTLIEILIVIGIIAILSSVVIIAVNPARQFAQARNTTRWTGVNSILNATHQNMVDNNGEFDFSDCPAISIPNTATKIAPDDANPGTDEVDLCGCLVPIYIATLPYDSTNGSYTDCTTYDTGLTVLQNTTTGRITIDAPDAELGITISVTR